MVSAPLAAAALASAIFCTSPLSGAAFSTPILSSDVAVRGRPLASAVRRGRGAAKDERHDILLTQKIISRHIETNMKEEDFVVKEFHVEDDDDDREWSEQLRGLKALVQGETYEPALTLARDTGSKIASAETYRPILECCKPVIDGVKSAGVLGSVKSAGSRIGDACRPVVGSVVSAGGKIASAETYRPALDKVKSAGCKVGDACKSASSALTAAETYKPAIDGVKSLASGETYKPALDKIKLASSKVGGACMSAGGKIASVETYRPALDKIKSVGCKVGVTCKPAINGVKSLAHKKTYKDLGRRLRGGRRRNKDDGINGEGVVVVAATTTINLGKLSVGTSPYVPGK